MASLKKYLPKNYKIEKDTELSEIKKFNFISFLKAGEDYINTEEMQKRAIELKANLGLTEAIHLIEHQDLISKDLQDKYIIFSGTVLRDPDGYLRVPYLYFTCDQWVLYFDWLDYDWDDYDRFACSELDSGSLGTSSGTRSLENLDARIKELEDFKAKVEKVLKI